MKRFFLAACFLLIMLSRTAAQHQHGVCGMTIQDGEELIKRMIANKLEVAEIPVQERGAVTYIPIHFHLVASGLSVGRHKEWSVLDQLCDLNNAYKPYDIQFYLSEHPQLGLFDNTINHDGVYTTQSNTFLMNNKRHKNALNVFVVNTAASGNTQPGTTLAYYSPTNDWVVSRKDQINGLGNGTLAHEIGHFFDLPHTFFGWESRSFDNTFPTWPVAPVISPGGSPTERQNGSNCTTSADKICDTPPDYNFGFIQGNCSPYTGGAQDPTGEPVNPMENNFMSYFSNCANYMFTPGQVQVMRTDIASSARNYLKNTFTPLSTSITLPSNFHLSPAQNETTATYDQVEFRWASVPEATHYLIEVDAVPNFTSPKLQTSLITGQNTTSIKFNLEPNRTYYWRVRPFNHYASCGNFAAKSFKTSTTSNTSYIPNVLIVEVAPNPVSGSEFTLMLDIAESAEMNMMITDATGRVLMQKNSVQLSGGNNVIPVQVEHLPNGAYFLNLTAQGRTMTKLITIVR